MKHDQPQLIDALASEYVLGTLRGAARRRFERWQSEEWHIASRVRTWEARLIPLALGLPPIAPSQELWQRIEARIRAADASRTDTPPRRAARPALRALAAVLVLCALFAGGVALFTTNDLHRLWGTAAAAGYLVAAVVTLAWPSRGLDLALVYGLCGALLVPLGWLAAQAQPSWTVRYLAAEDGRG